MYQLCPFIHLPSLPSLSLVSIDYCPKSRLKDRYFNPTIVAEVIFLPARSKDMFVFSLFSAELSRYGRLLADKSAITG